MHKKKMKILMALFFLTLNSQTLQAYDLKTLKKSLLLIQENEDLYFQGKKTHLIENPLKNEELGSYWSAPILNLYDGVSYFLLAKEKKDTDLELLKKSLFQIEKSLLSPLVLASSQAKKWKETVLNEIIRTSFEKKLYFQTIKYYLKLPSNQLVKKEWVEVYAQALQRTNQLTLFYKILKTYPEFFRAEKKYEKFKFLWEEEISKDKISDLEKIQGEAISLSKNQQIEFFEKNLEVMFYSKSLQKEFTPLLRYYFKILTKAEPSAEEVYYAEIMEKIFKKAPPEILLEATTLLWKNKFLEKAFFTCDLFLKNFKGHPQTPTMHFHQGRILEDLGKNSEALGVFTKSMDTLQGTSEAESILYHKGLLEFFAKESTTQKTLEKYALDYPQGKYSDEVSYLRFKLNPETSKEEIIQFIRKNPLNFFSLILIKEWQLDKTLITEQVSKNYDSLKEFVKQNHIYQTDIENEKIMKIYKELYDIGLYPWAQKTLRLLYSRTKNLEAMAEVVENSQTIEDPSTNLLQMAMIYQKFPADRKLLSWTGLFPEFEKKRILSILDTTKIKLPYYLIVSVIRQESAFHVEAESPAKAFGLMQLIKPTAKEVAEKIELENYDLFNIEHNLNLGIVYLSDMLKKFDGRLDLALSAYNAGPDATKRWFGFRKDISPLEFILFIPYQETRVYVKSVLRNYMLYDLLYSKEKDYEIKFHEPTAI